MSEVVTKSRLDPKRLKFLLSELEAGMSDVANGVRRMASAWRELKTAGYDLTALRARGGLWAYLDRVAEGALLPEILGQFAGCKTALRALASVDVSTQRQIMKTGVLSVVTDAGAAEDKPILRMTAREIERAIDPIAGRIVPLREQRAPVGKLKNPKRDVRVSIVLTHAEHEALLDASRRLKVSSQGLIVDAMRAAGLIGPKLRHAS